MKLSVEWTRLLPLRQAADQNQIYEVNLGRVPDTAGVYVFGRKMGDNIEALYVGKGNNLRSRIKGQFNNLRLMQHLKQAKKGKRFLFAGQAITKRGQRIKKVLYFLERSLIRHFLSEGHDLVNIQGVRIRSHEIESSGHQKKRFIPRLMYLEKSKGD
jgi:hypothetical protein